MLFVYRPHQEVRRQTQLHLTEVNDPSGLPANTVWCWTLTVPLYSAFCVVRSPISSLGRLSPEEQWCLSPSVGGQKYMQDEPGWCEETKAHGYNMQEVNVAQYETNKKKKTTIITYRSG